MPRTAKPKNTHRVTLDLPEGTQKQLEALREQTGANTLVEVFRRSLPVYAALWAEKANGATVIVRGADGQERELMFL